MARADLLTNLIRYGIAGEKTRFKKVAEAIAAEERAKQHNVLALEIENMLHSVNEEMTDNLNKINITDARATNLVTETIPIRKLNEMILSKETFEICRQVINEQHRSELLNSYNLEPRNRMLFIGPPGNGKTSLAEALANELMVPLLIARYENIVGSYLGETAARLHKLIEYVSSRKCVLFFDEFETLGKERGDSHETGEIKRVVSSLLMQIDALPSYVVVIGATNHPELLDRAVWRRFQIRLNLPQPTTADIGEWFSRFETRIGVVLGVSTAELAKRLAGNSFSDIEEFGITIYREYVLNQPNSDVRMITNNTLKQWPYRATRPSKS